MPQDTHLFGADHGALEGFQIGWYQQKDGTSQHITIMLTWGYRAPSFVYLGIPNDQTIAHYLGIWNQVLMNSPWWGKASLAHQLRKVVDRSSADGATVTYGGSRLPSTK